MAMRLLIIFGPPSVGKATIGKLIEEKTGYRLFHNHMIMDGVIHIFGIATQSENKLSKYIRTAVIKEAAKMHIDLIFTYVWDFSKPKGKRRMEAFKKIYEDQGGDVLFIELTAPLDVRINRATDPHRSKNKPHAPDAKRVAYLEGILDYKTPEPFYYPDAYYRIDTTNKSAEQTASEIVTLL